MAPSQRFSIGDTAGVAFAVAICAMFFVVVPAGAEPINTPPTIDDLMTTGDTLFGDEVCTLHCIASDIDDDELTYAWSATEGTIVADGATARWTAPRRAGTSSIMVQVDDGKGGVHSDIVLLTVLKNQSPSIDSVQSEPDRLLPGQVCTLTCYAFDADGHTLTYEWSSTRGVISGEGNCVEWTAPSASGTCQVSARVYDGYGGEVVSSELIEVVSPRPPSIEQLIVRPFAPDFTKAYDWGYRLLRGRMCECELECTASAEGKELTYEWSCSDGVIEGSGPVVLFIPPQERTEVTVVATVSDEFGHTSSTEVFFKVLTREGYSEIDEIPGGCQCGR